VKFQEYFIKAFSDDFPVSINVYYLIGIKI
jgi:hypothetical protein